MLFGAIYLAYCNMDSNMFLIFKNEKRVTIRQKKKELKKNLIIKIKNG